MNFAAIVNSNSSKPTTVVAILAPFVTLVACSSNPCPEYSGFGEEGRTRTYATIEDASDSSRFVGTATWTTTSFDWSSAEVVVESTFEVYDEFEQHDFVQTETSHYTCDTDGAWLSLKEILCSVLEDDTTEDFYAYTYDPPMLATPVDLELGTTWETSGDVTCESESSSHSEVYSQYWEAADEVEVTTDAGSFTGIELLRTVDDEDYRQIVEPDLGFVQSNYWELTDWSP